MLHKIVITKPLQIVDSEGHPLATIVPKEGGFSLTTEDGKSYQVPETAELEAAAA